MTAKHSQLCYVGLIFGLGLFFSIGLPHTTRAEETTVFRKEAGPDAFGKAVDISGDTLIVGAPSKHDGEVYIFTHQGDQWIQQQRIKAPRPTFGGWFGGAVCIDGDTAVVGGLTPFHGTGGFAPRSGVVYIYQREEQNFRLKQKLMPDDKNDGERFGFTVDLSGDTLVVGSPFHGNGSGPEIGAVYAYVRGEEGFQLQRTFFGELGSSRFGWSVAIDKDTIVIGLPFQRAFGGQGMAVVYVRKGRFWTRQAMLWAERESEGSIFGWSVDISGDRVIIGAPFWRERAGAAYIFTRQGDEWTQQIKLTASNMEVGARFGFTVDIDGTQAMVGAPFEDSIDEDAGAAYFFMREDDTWAEKVRLMPKRVVQDEPHNIWEGDVYGNSVAIAEAGSFAVVGAPGDNLRLAPPNPSGAAYVYHTEKELLGAHSVGPISLSATTLGDVKRTALFQNFPNPFNPETWIPYQLAMEAEVSISIYDVQGHRVRRIELGERSTGSYFTKETAAYWDGRNDDGELTPSGMYFYQLQVSPSRSIGAGNYTAVRRLVILK